MFSIKTFTAACVLAASTVPAGAQSAHRHSHAEHSHEGHGAHEAGRQAHRHAPAKRKPVRKAERKAVPAAAAPVVAARAHDRSHEARGQGHDHGPETDSLFGFVLGSDVEPKGTRSVAMEAIGRFGKRGGTYAAIGGKIEFAYGLTDNLSVAGAVLGAYYNVDGVPAFDNISRMRLNGIGGEARWRLLDRETHGVGLTLHVEPVWSTSDELTGLPARKWGAENKIILDTALAPEKVFAAFNFIHEMEAVREKGASLTERAAKIGPGVAIAAAVTKNVFIGAEARYLFAYEGLGFDAYAGRALYVGPTIHAKFDNGPWASLAWNTQVTGDEKGASGKYDLTNFERNVVRFKVGYDF